MPNKTVFFHSLIHSFSHVFYTPEHDGINYKKSAPRTKPLYIAMTTPSFHFNHTPCKHNSPLLLFLSTPFSSSAISSSSTIKTQKSTRLYISNLNPAI